MKPASGGVIRYARAELRLSQSEFGAWLGAWLAKTACN